MKRLKDIRESRDLTQEQASKCLGISITYLSMLENGKRNPSDKLKSKMTKLYQVGIADIFLAINSAKCLKRED